MSSRFRKSFALALLTATTFTGLTGYPVAVANPLQEPVSELSSKEQEDSAFGVPQVHSSLMGLHSGPAIVEHDGAPVPQPFDETYLGGYISDLSAYSYGVYFDVIDGFEDLRANHPEVLKRNMDIVVDYNNNSSAERIAIAQNDALADRRGVVNATADALGPSAAEALRTSIAEGRLPKTMFLLGNGYASRAGGLASSTFVEKFVYGYDRPFVQEPDRIIRHQIGDRDLYGTTPSFPSGHTNQATWITTLMAMMLPEMGPQLLERGSMSGESRLVMGVHFPLDVTAGRMAGTAAAADRLNDPKMNDAIRQAAQELRAELEWRTGKSIEELAAEARAITSDDAAVAAYTERMDYGFEPLYDQNAPMIVPQAAPVLLETAHPELDWFQRAEVLRQTAYRAGQPLDNQTEEGSWHRLNLAAAWAADVTVNPDGSVTVR
ncbi:acid phosphatase [Corynebacterium uterequi]|uniref:PAP2 superfamily protein n=1 Tax=Corynebacterium uterequi TaxID=1072256 RepID=A0A0G3HKC1_9CORY|nr:phosphatase PAP2 family protein [Corynebacterium uterequi]AKK11597.1 PAP2 superfamily protein [Corynebacterium uterequi]